MPDIYLSGRFSVTGAIEKAWLKRSGCKHRCFSFAFVCPAKIPGMAFNKNVDAALKVCEAAKIDIMMDSGAHSLHMINRKSADRGEAAKKKQAMDVRELRKQMFNEYVKFCHAGKDKWKFYVTLDFLRDQRVIYNMQKDFLREGLTPAPVYHGDSSIDWLKKHYDMGHKRICIGGVTLHPGKDGLRYYFEKVFNFAAKHDIKLHGLAFTSLDIIIGWPFDSVDSSTWSRVASFGMLIMPDVKRKKLFNIHVSEKGTSNTNTMHNMTKFQKDALTSILRDHDFDLKAMFKGPESGHERHAWNGYVMSNLDRFGVEAIPVRTWKNLI